MSALIDDLTQSLDTLLASGTGILASTLRRFLAKVNAAIAVLEARARGNRIFYTSGTPSDAQGMEGDLGVNKDNGDFFEFTGGTFVFLFNARPQAGSGGSYTLPAASPNTRGGSRVGQGLTTTDMDKLTLAYDDSSLGINASGELYVLNSGGNISPASTPANLTARFQGGNRGQRLDWDHSTGASLYYVYRQVNGGAIVALSPVPFNYYVDTFDQTGQYVIYYVAAANSAGESPRAQAVTSNPT